MSDRVSIPKLRELHAAPKTVALATDNLRFATPAQLAEYFSTHDALPALLDLAEAAHAWDTTPAMERLGPEIRIHEMLARFDFGDTT